MVEVGREVGLLVEQPAQPVGAGVPEPEHVADGDAVVRPVDDLTASPAPTVPGGDDPQVGAAVRRAR